MSHTPEENAAWEKAQKDRFLPPFPGTRWVHRDGGKYLIMMRSVMEDTLEQIVTYTSLDPAKKRNPEVASRTVKKFLAAFTPESNSDALQEATKEGFGIKT